MALCAGFNACIGFSLGENGCDNDNCILHGSNHQRLVDQVNAAGLVGASAHDFANRHPEAGCGQAGTPDCAIANGWGSACHICFKKPTQPSPAPAAEEEDPYGIIWFIGFCVVGLIIIGSIIFCVWQCHKKKTCCFASGAVKTPPAQVAI